MNGAFPTRLALNMDRSREERLFPEVWDDSPLNPHTRALDSPLSPALLVTSRRLHRR